MPALHCSISRECTYGCMLLKYQDPSQFLTMPNQKHLLIVVRIQGSTRLEEISILRRTLKTPSRSHAELRVFAILAVAAATTDNDRFVILAPKLNQLKRRNHDSKNSRRSFAFAAGRPFGLGWFLPFLKLRSGNTLHAV